MLRHSLLLVLGLSCWLQSHAAQELVGRVVSVSDGDTVKVLDSTNTQYKVRLSGIDAPEKSQPFGRRSKESLSSLVINQRVTVEWNKRDRYGRIVGKIITPKGTDANLEQIKRGMAWHYKQYEKEQPLADRAAYAAAELVAKESQEGLWQELRPVPPWEYRR